MVAGLVTAVVLVSASVGYQQLEQAREETTQNITARNQLLERSRLVRHAVWMTRESLAAFLLDPNLIEQHGTIRQFLSDAQLQTELLFDNAWIKSQQHQQSIQQLKSTLAELEKAIETLIDTRLDSNSQYPALALARANMLPNHSIFYTSADIAITELREEPSTDNNREIYQTFIQARHTWTQMISNFRMYLANRLGSFDESVLPVQEQDISTQHQGLQRLLDRLKKQDDAHHLEFQGSIALDDLIAASNSWHIAFQEIKSIHQTDDWRADAKLRRVTIKPRMEIIWNILLELDKSIETSANDDLSIITGVAERQTNTLWMLTALSLALIIIGFFALEIMIIRPFSSVASALKTESEHLQGAELSNYGTHEAQNLVDAFNAMRKQVQARQAALEYHALHDSLTNLGNRNRLTEHLNQAIKIANREDSTLALLMLDLNQFKEVNDTLGHPTGDKLLIEVGVRLSGLLRDTDTIARLGGDEFAILLPTALEAHALKIANKITSALSHPFQIDGQQLYTSASVGITAYPQHGLDARILIQHADIAMYQAKHNKTGVAVYDPDQDQHSLARLGLMADLRDALNQDKLDVFYQPQVSLAKDTAIGLEALLRWNHPEHGYISPEEIIRLAEHTGLIHDVAFWVLARAVKQTKEWLDAGFDLAVAVNLSAQNLEDDRIVEQVSTLLADNNFPPTHLTLEITENAMMANPERAVGILTQLDDMGIHISVDDYGTGFSSLSYLKRLPVHELKIDKSFVMDMTRDDNDAVIVRSTIDLAHNLGLTVVAEGVEDQDTWDLLEILRCDTAQGYFLSRPIPSTELLAWIKDQQSHAIVSGVSA